MTAPTFNTINASIARHGVELVKGGGYFYFAALDGAPAGIEDAIPSVYSIHLRAMSLEQWIAHVEEAVQKWQNEHAQSFTDATRLCITALEIGTDKAKEMAREELMRYARELDRLAGASGSAFDPADTPVGD